MTNNRYLKTISRAALVFGLVTATLFIFRSKAAATDTEPGGIIRLQKSILSIIQNILGSESTVSNEVPNTGPTNTVSVFKKISQPIYLPPITIAYGKKTLEVEEVGVEEGGALGVPSTWQTAGWYKDGAKAGEKGNLIVDGHYDTNTGAPGAFWELKDLQLGDKVFLTDKLGRVYEYSVTYKTYVSINDPERSKVFESGEDKILTLITCGGVWDYASGTYNKRLVVTAVFNKMEKSW